MIPSIPTYIRRSTRVPPSLYCAQVGGRKLSHEQNRLMRTKVHPALSRGKTSLFTITTSSTPCKYTSFLPQTHNDHDDSHHLLAPRGSFVRPGACPREAVPRRRRFFPVSHFFQAENVVAPPSAGARQRSLVWALDFLGALEAAHPLPRSVYGGDEENL